MKRFLSQFHLQKDGLESVLGELESAIMKCVWQSGPLTVRQVHEKLSEERELAYTTVMTVMSRLSDKGLLGKEKTGNAFVYSATTSEGEFAKKTRGEIIDSLLHAFGTPVISQFVESIGREHPEKIEELARLVEQQRRQERE